MPRLINTEKKPKDNGYSFIPLPSSLHRDEDSFIKACRVINVSSQRGRGRRRHTIASASSPSRSNVGGSIVNELLSTLMVPWVAMSDNCDDNTARIPASSSEAANDNDATSSSYHEEEGRNRRSSLPSTSSLNAVSFDEGKEHHHHHRSSDSAAAVLQDVGRRGDDRTTTTATEQDSQSYSLERDERSAFSSVSASYDPSSQPPSVDQSQDQAAGIAQAEDSAASTAESLIRMQFRQTASPPTATTTKRQDPASASITSHVTPSHHHAHYPYNHHHPYGYHHHPHHLHPPYYDYSVYYPQHHHEQRDGTIMPSSSTSPYHNPPSWSDHQQQPQHVYNPSYQDYTSYYSSSSSPHEQHHHHAIMQQHASPYSQQHSHHEQHYPHSAPPTYHRSSLRSPPPMDDTPDVSGGDGATISSKKNTKQRHAKSKYEETPSAITEGTTPSSKQSPPLELQMNSPPRPSRGDVTFFTTEHDAMEEDERKPAAKPQGSTERSHHHYEQRIMQPPPPPPHDDPYEPIPFWNEPRSSSSHVIDPHYRSMYPPPSHPSLTVSNQHQHPEYPTQRNLYVVDPAMVGLPSHRYNSPPPPAAAAAAGSMPSTATSLQPGGEGTSWEKRFAELLEFRSRHGHCEVPQNYKDNTSLGIWVNKQRMEQKLRMEGKNSSLNDVRLHRLEAVGFRWAKRKGQASWDEKYEELRAYKRRHGNCHVPTKYKQNTALGRWVSTQRAEYKKYCEGEKSNMTPDKIRRLEEVGFAWFMAL